MLLCKRDFVEELKCVLAFDWVFSSITDVVISAHRSLSCDDGDGVNHR